ncbi:MAG TPA: FHA domain-containing protein [Ktedonobacterales bacterium]|jgi:pSer/pThr/pTyr-binding forkhead associated (FHA) protein|nr:FHA domain-containing protein [Ktedonobacterales bacterium]
MAATDFPAWYSAGIFGGIGCALLSAIAIATWSLWRGQGVTRQAISGLLVCVIASALDIGPLLWIEYRLSVYGPTLAVAEVGAALAVAALVGWVAPLGAICWYSLQTSVPAAPAPPRSARSGAVSPAALDDPARARTVTTDGRPWGLLAPVTTTTLGATAGRPIELAHALTIIGREQDNDIVLDDERVSRRHAELRWERGRVELADYGSLNGTRVNQQAMRGRAPLRDGDIIELGSHRYRLMLQPGDIAAEVADADAEEPEELQTRKTASASGSFSLGAARLQMTLIQGTQNESPAGETRAWPLVAPVTTIGRDATCGIVLSDTSISRVHAQITRQPAGHFIADLQSSNGVSVNGQRLTAPTQIFAGDVVTLGDCLLRCEETRSTSRATAGPATPIASQASTRAEAIEVIEAPSFHMRIAPEWVARRTSRPRLAPPRLTPTPRQNQTPPLN